MSPCCTLRCPATCCRYSRCDCVFVCNTRHSQPVDCMLVGEDATLTVVVSCGWCRDIGDNSISGPIPGSIVSLSVLQELYVLPHSNLHL